MDNLYIDYEKGIDLGERIKNKSFELNELLKRIENIHNKIEDNDINKLNIDLKSIIKLSEVVKETGDFLINVSKAYNDVDNFCNQKEE